MTGGPPDIDVDFSADWVSVTSDDDLAAWGPEAARELWARSGGEPGSDFDVQLLAAELELAAKCAFVLPCFGAFVFCPEPSRGPRAVLRVSGLAYPAGTDEQEVLDAILIPAEQQLLPPQIGQLAGPGLRCLRVRQRAWSTESGAVTDHIAYLLPFDGGAWMLSTAIPDPREAERWLADLDELAAGVQLR